MKTLTLVVCLLLTGQVLSSQSIDDIGQVILNKLTNSTNGYIVESQDVFGKKVDRDDYEVRYINLGIFTGFDMVRTRVSSFVSDNESIEVTQPWAKEGEFYSMLMTYNRSLHYSLVYFITDLGYFIMLIWEK